MKEITISEILAKIEKGEPIHHAIIKCELNPKELNLRKENGKFLLPSKLSMVFCRIDGNVNFENTIFKGNVSFIDSRFNGGINFSKSQFCNGAFFINTRFCRPASFGDAKFKGTTNFTYAKFYGPAYFGLRVQFDKGADFCHSVFSKLAYFKADFKGNASFISSQFKASAPEH